MAGGSVYSPPRTRRVAGTSRFFRPVALFRFVRLFLRTGLARPEQPAPLHGLLAEAPAQRVQGLIQLAPFGLLLRIMAALAQRLAQIPARQKELDRILLKA